MKNIIRLLALVLLAASIHGCATMDTAVRKIQREYHQIQGQYYLSRGDFAAGRDAFAPRVAQFPDDAELNYFMARFELGADKPEAALPFIQKAAKLSPANADYRFWEGVAYWALMKPDKERAAYEKALAIDPDHLSANLYLAHNMLDRGKNAEALRLYDKTLSLNPEEPQAMFNRAVTLERMKRDREMKLSLHRYLERHPDAPLARQGVRMLNKAGDFTWRNHVIGLRTISLRSVEFLPGSATLTESAEASLKSIGEILSKKTDLSVHVVAYVKGDKTLARQRALAVRNYVSREYPQVAPERLAPSWFDKPESIKTDGRTHSLAQSINIFTKVQ
jgi:tetratricopeptide (TPR) repeat protein